MTTLPKNLSPTFHPSLFESQQKDIPGNERTLLMIREQRGKVLNKEIKDLESPGSFKFTINDKQISGSNTRHLLKNLYGETPLTFLFFSEQNINNIQKLIRHNVFKETGKVIDNQSIKELMVIMRSIFLEYHAHPPLFNEKMTPEEIQELKNRYFIEVKRLNEIVIRDILPRVVSGMQQYLDYLRDISKAPEQIARPKAESITGQREYRSITQLLLGSDL